MLAAALLSMLLAATPVIDGTINAEEWKDAHHAQLEGGGEMWATNDGEKLYVATRGTKNNIVSVCIGTGRYIEVLHASAALGSAQFSGPGPEWKNEKEFKFSVRANATPEERAKFLESEGWIANPRREGGLEREFAIKLTGFDRRRFAVAVLYVDEPMSVAYWPATVADDCKAVRLGQGYLDRKYVFAPKGWSLTR